MVIALVEKKPFGVVGVGRNIARMEYVHSANMWRNCLHASVFRSMTVPAPAQRGCPLVGTNANP